MSKTRITIFTALYFSGILAQLLLIFYVTLWGITGTLEQNMAAVPILIIQGIIVLRSGGWWLPICAWLTGLPLPDRR